MQCEAQFDDIYEFPPELLDFALFSCVCPVFVPSAEQLSVYKAFIGRKCKCEVGKRYWYMVDFDAAVVVVGLFSKNAGSW